LVNVVVFLFVIFLNFHGDERGVRFDISHVVVAIFTGIIVSAAFYWFSPARLTKRKSLQQQPLNTKFEVMKTIVPATPINASHLTVGERPVR
jgi:hypothetical protein